MATKLSYEEFKTSLEQFIGTEKYYKVGFTPIVCTDGIKYFADTCECYWLLDTITYKLYKKHQQLGYLFIEIKSNRKRFVHIIARQDKDRPIVFKCKQKDTCKTIPVGTYMFYLMNNVLLLPDEY